jgi:hypothetical protein
LPRRGYRKPPARLVVLTYKYFDEVNADPVVYHWTYKLNEISEDEAKGDIASYFLFNTLDCQK